MNMYRYNDFVNEGKGKFGPSKLGLVTRNIELRKGDAVIITADKVDPKKDIDFSRTAKTWWGKNVYSHKNKFKSDFIWHLGDVIMIAATDNNIGYIGGGGDVSDDYDISPILLYISREDGIEAYRREMIDILIDQGMAKIVKYDELDKEFRDKFELDVVYDRLVDANHLNELSINGESLGSDEEWLKVVGVSYYRKSMANGIEISVIINKREEKFIFSISEILNAKFKWGDNLIDGDPFNSKLFRNI